MVVEKCEGNRGRESRPPRFSRAPCMAWARVITACGKLRSNLQLQTLPSHRSLAPASLAPLPRSSLLSPTFVWLLPSLYPASSPLARPNPNIQVQVWQPILFCASNRAFTVTQQKHTFCAGRDPWDPSSSLSSTSRHRPQPGKLTFSELPYFATARFQ